MRIQRLLFLACVLATLWLARPAAALFLVGDSLTVPTVAGGGPGYTELIPGAEWIGCAGAIAASLDSRYCSLLEPPVAEVSFLDEFVVPAARGHAVATILFGSNDALWPPRGVPDEAFVEDILTIALALHREADVERVIYLGPPDRASDLPGPVLTYYDSMLPSCEAISYLECGPNFQDLIGPEHYDPSDDVHPNALGHQVMASAVLTYVPEPGVGALVSTGPTALAMARKRSSSGSPRPSLVHGAHACPGSNCGWLTLWRSDAKM